MMKHVAILGGGISGLTLAWYLQQQYGNEIQITLLEKSHRVGGWIQTLYKNDFIFELGPRSCRPHGTGAHTLTLLKELGLEEEILYPDDSAHIRYLYINQKLTPIPRNPIQWLFSPLKKGLLSALWKDWRTKPDFLKDESIYDFVSRRLGPNMAETFVDPLVSGIYAGNIRELSVGSCFPKLKEWETNSGGILRGILKGKKSEKTKGSLFTLSKGMETLPYTLAQKLKHKIRLNADVEAIKALEDKVQLILKGGELIEADYLYCAAPSAVVAQYFDVPVIPSASIAVVCLGYCQQVLKQRGFGYLIPSSQNESILGAVWDSSIFPSQNLTPNQTRITVMIGGSRMKNFVDFSESDFNSVAFNALRKHLAIQTNPDVQHVHIAKNAIPQYLVGHGQKTEEIKKQIGKNSSRIRLLGSSYSGVSVNDCIAEAKKCALEFPQFFAKKI